MDLAADHALQRGEPLGGALIGRVYDSHRRMMAACDRR